MICLESGGRQCDKCTTLLHDACLAKCPAHTPLICACGKDRNHVLQSVLETTARFMELLFLGFINVVAAIVDFGECLFDNW